MGKIYEIYTYDDIYTHIYKIYTYDNIDVCTCV